MANINDTKNRLSSAKTTQKVIKAMELVASSKIKKAKDNALNIEFYLDTTIDAMRYLYSYSQVKQLLNRKHAADKTLIVAITSDLGLCGAYNGNVIKELEKQIKLHPNSEKIILGTKGVAKMNYEHVEVKHKFVNYGSLNELTLAQDISKIIIDKYHNNEINDVKIIYTKFINALVQEVQVLDLFKLEEVKHNENYITADLIVEPDPEIVFKQLIEQYILSMTYSALLQSIASEHSYRRNSMESANNNSLELIDKLNLELNRIRQAMITQEISEIIGGSEALNKG